MPLVFLTAWLLPATTARRTAHVSLAGMWLLHFVSALPTVAVIVFLVAWIEAGTIMVEVGSMLVDFGDELERHPVQFPLIVVGIASAIEAGFLGLALLVMPWGARDEPVRSSYRNALRQTWLRSTHVIPVVLLVGVVAVTIDRIDSAWRAANPGFAGSWWAEPWYIKYSAAFVAQTCFAGSLWIVWGLLRGVGASRETPPVTRPPTCEACGYNLSTIPMESRCPECGEPVIASLGPDSRRGPSWLRRQEIGTWRAWAQTSMQALTQPDALGRQLWTISPGADHRRFVAMHLLSMFLVGACSIATFSFVETGQNPFVANPEAVYIAGPVLGSLFTLGALGLMSLAANVIGLTHSFREKRNLMPGSMQIAAYLSPYLTLSLLFALFSGVVFFLLAETWYLQGLADLWGIDRELLAFMMWLLPNLVWFFGYFVLVGRGTRSTRYANR